MKKIKHNYFVSTQANRNWLSILFVFLFLLSTQTGFSQKKWGFDFRTNVNFPTKDLGDAKLKVGVGFEGNLSYQLIDHLAVYAGWSWNQFYTNQSFLGNDVDFEETGYTFGLLYAHQVCRTNIKYVFRGGATYNHIESENKDGKIINDTGHGFGWQAGAGLQIPIGNNLQVNPELRYRSLARDINIGTTSTAVQLNYVSANVGLIFSF